MNRRNNVVELQTAVFSGPDNAKVVIHVSSLSINLLDSVIIISVKGGRFNLSAETINHEA